MGARNDRSGVRTPRPITHPGASVVALVAFVIGSLTGCSSSDESAPPASTAAEPTGAPPSTTASSIESTTIASTTAAPMTTTSTTTGPASLTIRCDADSAENPTFEVPLGTSVTLVASSSIEREYHLHGYDIELTGDEVTFQFTATLPGSHELTEHPDHSTVCTIVS